MVTLDTAARHAHAADFLTKWKGVSLGGRVSVTVPYSRRTIWTYKCPGQLSAGQIH